MAEDRFPYDMPSRQALVELARREKPNDNIKDEFVVFGDMFFGPVPGIPGRTFIEMDNLLTKAKRWFVYRRLDLDKTPLGRNPTLTVMGKATPANIAKEINRSRGMYLDYTDVDFGNEILHTGYGTFTHVLKALPGSFVYYGHTTLTVTTVPELGEFRVLEDGTDRLLENGSKRLLE